MNHGKDDKTGDIMRIFLASYQAVMLNKSGPSYKLIHTKKALQEKGIDVEFYNMWDHDLKIRKDNLFHLFNASVSTYSLAKNLKRYGAKYVVNPIFYSNHNAKTIKLYRNLKKPINKIFKRSMSDYDFTKYICDNSEQVLPNTSAEGKLLENGLDVDQNIIQVIHNGVEERFANGDPSLFQKKYDVKDFVLYVGHLGSYRKNGMNIIKAAQKIDTPVYILANVFDNAEGERCVEEIKKSMNITLIRWIEHYDPLLASAYAACKTFVLPSKYETPGRAALEAGLAGANIVITPNGGTKEYFLDHAEYPNPDSVNSIVKSIEKSLNKQKNDKLKKRILKKYIWEKIAENTLTIYKKVL